MADTVRTRSEVLALLPDNTSGLISPQDLRDTVVSVLGVYGGIAVYENASTLAFNTSISDVLVFTLEYSDAESGTTPDAASGSITVNTSGVFLTMLTMSIRGMNASTKYTFHLMKDSARVVGASADVRVVDTDDIINVSIVFPITCTSGDVISVGGESDAPGGQNAVITQAQLVTYRIF